MSIEALIAENTATMKQLIAVLSTAVEAGGVTAPAGDTTDTGTDGAAEGGKRKRRTKAEIEADNAAAAAAAGNAQAAAPAPVAATPSAAPAAAPAASTATPAATTTGAAAPTMDSIIEKLKKVHARDGNAGVKPILDQFGVANVPGLAAKNLAEVDAAVEKVLNPNADASLFG